MNKRELKKLAYRYAAVFVRQATEETDLPVETQQEDALVRDYLLEIADALNQKGTKTPK